MGSKPSFVTSVAELMVQDSDINAYEDTNVVLPDQAEFNIRGRVIKVLSKKEKEQQQTRRQEIAARQRIKIDQAKKKAALESDEVPILQGKNLQDQLRRQTVNEWGLVT